MNFASRTSSLQAYHILLFRKAIHPEFFGIDGRKRISHGGYEFEGWVFNGGHALLFRYDGLCITEVITDRPEAIPESGLITCLPCAGERDHEEKVAERIEYIASMQTETLSDHLYLSTYNEMLEHGRESESLLSLWKDEGRRHNLSLIDMQRYRDEVHIQGYHLRSDCALVLRTQTIFRALNEIGAEAGARTRG